MIKKRNVWLLLLLFLAVFDASMIHRLENRHDKNAAAQLTDAAQSLATLRAFELPLKACARITSYTDDTGIQAEYMLAAAFTQKTEPKTLRRWCALEKQANPARYGMYVKTVETLFTDAVCFPVAKVAGDKKATVSYENSWQNARTYGGERGHEGCDLMAAVKRRGYYPIVSVSDGVIEKKGWLPQGGYRVGVRSPHGVYYYYAHLSEYAPGLHEGQSVAAGEMLGYMGDTGYSEIEGTCGNFPVHLHFGMYLNSEDGGEQSFNPYALLKILESKEK